jgi:hypothetical protein
MILYFFPLMYVEVKPLSLIPREECRSKVFKNRVLKRAFRSKKRESDTNVDKLV